MEKETKETSAPKQEELNKETKEETEETKETEKETKETTEETKESEKGEIDYKAKLEEEEVARKKAESSAQFHREEAAKLRKEKGEEEPPITRKDLEEVEARTTRQAFRASVEAEARRIARNPDEAALIIFHYEHSVMPTGDVLKDVTRARLIANEGRVEKEIEELQATLNSKGNLSTALPSSGKVDTQPSAPALSDDVKKLIAMNNMTWNTKEGVFKNERGVTYNVETDEVFDPGR